MILTKAEIQSLLLLSRDEFNEDACKALSRNLASGDFAGKVVRGAIVAKTFGMCLESYTKIQNLGLDLKWAVGPWREKVYRDWLPRLVIQKMCNNTIRDLLSAEGLDFAFIRGVPFADYYYKQPHLRIGSDIDILVHENSKEHAVSLLLDNGFEYRKAKAFRDAYANIIGQVELRHKRTSTVLDLNWQLTANVGVGKTNMDMERLWGRASHLSPFEWRISAEDCLLNAIRHAVQGHGCHSAVLFKTCPDVYALMRKEAGNFDWDYYRLQEEKTHSMGATELFWNFYRNYYLLGESSWSMYGNHERGFYIPFENALEQGFRWLGRKPGSVASNLEFAMRIGTIRDWRRLFAYLKAVYFPKRDIVVLINDENSDLSVGAQFLYAARVLVLVLPGVIVGVSYSIWTIFSRRWRPVQA